jgi:uncharacterized PurR-regulated membrane protein YhhQ (DUF165 family)
MSTYEDRWLLPRRQTEYPLRDLVDEPTLHARREATFLVLATIVIAATTAMILLAGSVIDVTALAESLVPRLDLPVIALLPLGALTSAFAFVAAMLVCELYGRRRAFALAWASVLAAGAGIGLARVVELAGGPSFVGALALAAYYVPAQLATLLVFDEMRSRAPGRRLWLRTLVAMFVGQVFGASAFGAVVYAGDPDVMHVGSLVLGTTASAFACTLVLLVPLAICAHVLALYLRVARYAADEPAYEEGPAPLFSLAEQKFFRDGERMAS